MSERLYRRLEFTRDIRQHVISRISRRRGKDLSDSRGFESSLWSWLARGSKYENTALLTITLSPPFVNTRTRNQHIVDERKDTLAANPVSIFVLHSAIVKYSGLVKLDAASMNCSSKGNLFRMEVFPARFPHDIERLVTQNIFN